VGIRDAHVENPNPDTKKNIATMIRLLPGERGFACLIVIPPKIKKTCRVSGRFSN
jgi:hypothetical protein